MKKFILTLTLFSSLSVLGQEITIKSDLDPSGSGYAESSYNFRLEAENAAYLGDITWELFILTRDGGYVSVQQSESSSSDFHTRPVLYNPDFQIEDNRLTAYAEVRYTFGNESTARTRTYGFTLNTLPEFLSYRTDGPVPTASEQLYTLALFAEFANTMEAQVSYTADGSAKGSRTFGCRDNTLAFSVGDFEPMSDYEFTYTLANSYGHTEKTIGFPSPGKSSSIVCGALGDSHEAYAVEDYTFELRLPDHRTADNIEWTYNILTTSGSYTEVCHGAGASTVFTVPRLSYRDDFSITDNRLSGYVEAVYRVDGKEYSNRYELSLKTRPEIESVEYVFNKEWGLGPDGGYSRPAYTEPKYDITLRVQYRNTDQVIVSASRVGGSGAVNRLTATESYSCDFTYQQLLNNYPYRYRIQAENSFAVVNNTLTINAADRPAGIEEGESVESQALKTEYYDASGLQIDNTATPRVHIRKTTMSDGSVHTEKIVR